MRYSLTVVAFLVLGMGTAFGGSIAIGQAVDKGDFSTVTHTGLDWVDISLTHGMSYDQVVASSWYTNGWRHATKVEVATLLEAFNPSGIDTVSSWEGDWWTFYEGVVSEMAPYLGSATPFAGLTYMAAIRELDAQETSVFGTGTKIYSLFQDWDQKPGEDFVDIAQTTISNSSSSPVVGHFLVRATPTIVPLPASAWMGLGLLSLLGLARRLRRTH